jgi:hypothetical protein
LKKLHLKVVSKRSLVAALLGFNFLSVYYGNGLIGICFMDFLCFIFNISYGVFIIGRSVDYRLVTFLGKLLFLQLILFIIKEVQGICQPDYLCCGAFVFDLLFLLILLINAEHCLSLVSG